MKYIYYIKSQPRLFILSTICLTILVIATNFLLQSYGSWRMERVFITLLPVFFTANVISDEYEHKREGFLFVTNTPVYKLAAIKFIYGWLFAQVFMLLMFISAYAIGMEPDFTRWMVIVIYSTYLSLIGLTVSNITKQSLFGFGAALVYWIVMLTMGFSLNERLWPISVILNNDLSVQVVWRNLASLLCISYLLIMFNIWFIGKGEGIRKRITTINVLLLFAVLVTAGVYGYTEKQKAEAPFRIINAAHNNETIVIMGTNDPEVKEELDKRNIAYVSPDAVNKAEFSEHDIVLITSSEDASESAIITELLSESNVEINERGIRAGDKEIYQADSYRFILDSSLNTQKDVVHLHSRNWTRQGISYLLNAQSGDFIALNQGIQVARSNYSIKNIDSLDEHLTLSNAEAWFVKGDDEAKLLYHNLSESKAAEFLTLWEEISLQVNKMLPVSMNVDVLQITNEQEGQSENLKSAYVLKINYHTVKELEPYKFGGRDWIEKIAVSMLSQTIFHNIEDKELQYTWSKYILLNKMGHSLETEIKEEYWRNNYEFRLTGTAQSLLEESEYLLGNQELLNGGNVNSIFYYLLHRIDNSGVNTDSLLHKVMLAPNKLDEKALKILLAKYIPQAEIDPIFEVYDKVISR